MPEGTNLLDAAKRLGVPIPTECHGRGECDTCAVTVIEGAGLLSSPSTSEHERLGQERLAMNQRLTCQTRVERSGELVLVSMPAQEGKETADDAARKFKEEFRELPLGKKIKRLAEFEAVSAFEALTTIAGLPFTVGEKVLDVVADFGRRKKTPRQTQRVEQTPDED